MPRDAFAGSKIFVFYYCCSGTVACPAPTVNPQLIVCARESYIPVPPCAPSPSFPRYHPPPSLWLLSVCSLFQCP